MQKSSSVNSAPIRKTLAAILQGHQDACQRSFKDKSLECLESITREILKALKSGKKILICGNGGSAADAQHIAAEFVVRFKRDRQSLAAIALTADTSILTAAGNDLGFADIFSRQVEGLGCEGDVLIALSTSGKSPNVLKSVAVAKAKRMVTIGFTGADGGELKTLVDLCFQVESQTTSHIQEVYLAALHAVTESVDEVLFG